MWTQAPFWPRPRCYCSARDFVQKASLLSFSWRLFFFAVSYSSKQGGSTLFPTCLSALRCDLQREARPCGAMRSDAMRCWMAARIGKTAAFVGHAQALTDCMHDSALDPRMPPPSIHYHIRVHYSLNMQSPHHQHHQRPPAPQRTHMFTTNSCTTRLVLRVPVDPLPHSAIFRPFLRDTKNRAA